jgi:hypothetical protein
MDGFSDSDNEVVNEGDVSFDNLGAPSSPVTFTNTDLLSGAEPTSERVLFTDFTDGNGDIKP